MPVLPTAATANIPVGIPTACDRLRDLTVTPTLQGGCLCGSVRYSCAAKPVYAYFCHCLDCQKESGSPFVTELYVPRSSVVLTGKTSRYTRTGDSGKSVHRNFCSSCGTVVLTEFDVEPDNVSVKACSLDDPSWVTPNFHLYVRRKQPWLKLNDGLQQFDGDF
jgi:hypothetical protein